MQKKEIIKELKEELDSKRYEHTLGVAYTAASLAMAYEMDVEKAYIAGLLHDCAKCMSDKERITYCKKHDIEMTEVELKNPSLLHAKVGSYLAADKYNIKDEEILSSIKYHTTGKPQMSAMEEIIFVADYIEPMREHDRELPQIRKEAFCDIKKAIRHIYHNTLSYLSTTTKSLDPMTEEAYKYYLENN